LRAQGRAGAARLEVVEGAERGARAALREDGDLVVGRAQDVDLRLSDASLSRRHVAVCRSGEGYAVRDLGSKGGASLDGVAVTQEPMAWKPGQTLRIGETAIALVDPLPEAADEIRAAADVKMKRADLEKPPPGTEAPVVAAPDEAAEALSPVSPPVRFEEVEPEPSGRWLATVDVMVALVALALLAASGFGLMYVLG